jgi:hypothetical protein
MVMGVAIFLTWLEDVSRQWIPFASLLSVMAIGFIILEKSEAIAHIISQKLKKLWIFAELLLFVLVGAQVNIHVAWKAGLAGTVVILVGLFFRSVGTYISLFGTPFDWREKLFCIVAYIPKATVQAAIGAVPLAAGVVSGEIILAVAVLSILLTAPLGAIGIAVLGERILDRGSRSEYTFKDLRRKLGIPHVGERVRSKRFGTVWKVIEQKEMWIPDTANPRSPDKAVPLQRTPAIFVRYWREDTSPGPGRGKTLSCRYTPDDPSFPEHWEVLYDW